MIPPVKRSDPQLRLPFFRDAVCLEADICRAMGGKVALVITDNSTSMISVRKGRECTVLRLHRMFLTADCDVISELARYIRNSRLETPLLREFIRVNRGLIRSAPFRREKTRTGGRFHDLQALFDRVNGKYFGGRITSLITWGRSNGTRVRRRTLGSYHRDTDLIRINPVLDRRAVPRYFLEFIVYHEMLHADMGVEERDGRRLVHSKEFRRRERLYDRYDDAIAWEERGL